MMRSVHLKKILTGILAIASIVTASPVSAAPFVIPDLTNPYWQRQWYLRQIQAPQAWQLATSTKDVIVAVIDAGVDITHPDLKDAIWTNPREIPGNGIDDDGDGYIDDVHGWNFVTNSGDVRPQEIQNQLEEAWSHGTFVSSLIGARSIDHVGMVGVNQSVQIMPLTALDGDGYGTIPNVLQAIRYAVNQGASVINLSLAGFDNSPDLAEMIKRARDAGVLVVAATGNGDTKAGRDTDIQPIYPACFDQSTNIVVGVSGTDSLDQHAAYANYGTRCTDLSAPGFELFGARPSYPRTEEGNRKAERYLDGMTGTSLAAPLVSGVASLLKAVRPDLTVDQLHQLLSSTADTIEANLTYPQRGKMGTGRLNAFKALQAALVFGQATTTDAGIGSLVSVGDSQISSEETPSATSFYCRTSTTTLRWLVAPKPLWSHWTAKNGSPLVTAFLKDGVHYYWKQWNPLTNQERVVKIAPPTGQTWTAAVLAPTASSTLMSATTTQFALPAWLLMSSKKELRVVRGSDAKILTVAGLKNMPMTAAFAWNATRSVWTFTDAKTKKTWTIDLNARLTIR